MKRQLKIQERRTTPRQRGRQLITTSVCMEPAQKAKIQEMAKERKVSFSQVVAGIFDQYFQEQESKTA